MADAPFRIVEAIYPGMTQLDFTAPHTVFSRIPGAETIVASVKVPTTHGHADGVAAGIVDGLDRLLREHAIDPASIAFIAHSTTQATNALLEGDVARVGVLALGGPVTRAFARFAPFALAEGVRFAPQWLDARTADPVGAARKLRQQAKLPN